MDSFGWVDSQGDFFPFLRVQMLLWILLPPPPKKKKTSSLNSFAHPGGIDFSSNVEAIRSPGAWRPEGTWEKRMDSVK